MVEVVTEQARCARQTGWRWCVPPTHAGPTYRPPHHARTPVPPHAAPTCQPPYLACAYTRTNRLSPSPPYPHAHASKHGHDLLPAPSRPNTHCPDQSNARTPTRRPTRSMLVALHTLPICLALVLLLNSPAYLVTPSTPVLPHAAALTCCCPRSYARSSTH